MIPYIFTQVSYEGQAYVTRICCTDQTNISQQEQIIVLDREAMTAQLCALVLTQTTMLIMKMI